MANIARMGPGLGESNEYVDFSRWALRQALEHYPILAEGGTVLDQKSTASRRGVLIFKQGRGTTKDNRRFEYSCLLRVDSADEEDTARLSVVESQMRIWWIPVMPTNDTLPLLAVDAGVGESEWSDLLKLAGIT